MKIRFNLLFLFFFFSLAVFAQDNKVEDFKFTIVKQVGATSVKNQCRTGTCWAYATSSFWESELLRITGKKYDISEMFVVRKTYPLKAEKYIRLHGNSNFSEGGQAHDVLNIIRKYGMIPESIYNGKIDDVKKYNHHELTAVMKGILDGVIKQRGEITPNWRPIIEFTLDQYLGKAPEKFEFEGKEYTPKSFAEESGLNPDDYIELTSYTHHPFYRPFVLELPDNWTGNEYYNLPMDELIEVITNAIDNGYSVAWDGDCGGDNFYRQEGYALIPDKGEDNMYPVKEKNITQEMRQRAFDTFSVTDDHLMHIVGIANDQDGKEYFLTKNSWGKEGKVFDGYWYMSLPYVQLKTIAIMIHKDALPSGIAEKLGL